MPQPLSVAVFICLEWQPNAGGHVKCWERFAEAASHYPDCVDLTIYFLGAKQQTLEVAANVRYQLLPPQFSTHSLEIMRQGAGVTDVAPLHWGLRRYLPQHQVFHITDTFSFAQTVRRFCRQYHRPLLSSIHTDLPLLTRTYSREIIWRMSGRSWGREFWRWLWLEKLQVDQWFGYRAERKLAGFMRASDRVLVSRQQDADWLLTFLPPERVAWFQRGIDRDRFHPRFRNPQWLREEYHLPEVPIALFVGRVDASKNVLLLAQAAQVLTNQGKAFHVLIVGEGAQATLVKDLLGDRVTLTGKVPQEKLGAIYASSDLFVFPSESETGPNVVVEARAAGLPVVISGFDGGRKYVQTSGEDGVVVYSRDPQDWAAAITPLLDDAHYRQRMGTQAHQITQATCPTWQDAFEQSILCQWEAVAQAYGWPQKA
ncbi:MULTISPECIES: glycosyltransferase [unclassified Thermosynechococcus]|uniref:glycosyltransferase n=1 Tax=unclassified Thermosynechococcus TaxID=2622553 RepID=UPI002873CBB0|nr:MULTISPECIES: glycosyltransferase [unclassified Thermosynechococcus]WNC31343.1 glycosyltransferase [Thermosynechococcus sp. PKX95]WNC33867.1 glycosyltransferase [Thermosynechococcus sp. PKX91]WNC36391.1 glycosyltransferase [Thermosynechococcus sp. WL11]WNC38912.1 glycosyltransferase [Thermosynechococcus sp. WL17]WNC41434.1 glycosyltransferase [Thermosynechococcus sp. WL15]